jgi:hypothetical protein
MHDPEAVDVAVDARIMELAAAQERADEAAQAAREAEVAAQAAHQKADAARSDADARLSFAVEAEAKIAAERRALDTETAQARNRLRDEARDLVEKEGAFERREQQTLADLRRREDGLETGRQVLERRRAEMDATVARAGKDTEAAQERIAAADAVVERYTALIADITEVLRRHRENGHG